MIKVMLDTNIFISAALFPKGKVAQAFIKAIQPPFQPYVCDYVIDEALHFINRFCINSKETWCFERILKFLLTNFTSVFIKSNSS